MSEGNASSVTLTPGESIKPNVSSNVAIKLVKDYFGYDVLKIRELNSYDDVNYLVDVAVGAGSQKFVFKVLNSMDSQKTAHIEAQAEIMEILNRNGINCSLHEKTLQGQIYALVTLAPSADNQNNTEAPGRTHLIRLLKFVPGTIYPEATQTNQLLFKAGKYVSKLEQYLKDFRHVGLEGHESIWFLSGFPKLRNFMYVLDDKPERKSLVTSVLEAYDQRVAPAYPNLAKGILHGDFNEQNIICSQSPGNANEFDIYGVIDFGDVNVGHYVNELAITICYMTIEGVKNGQDPLEVGAHVLAGYSTVRAVPQEELDVLRILICARLCQSLVMGAYSYSLDPGNTYLLTTASTGWPLLEKLWRQTTDEEIQRVWKTVAQSYNASE